MLGIIGAMELEVSALYEKMENKEENLIAGMKFCKGKLEGKDAVVVKSGVGKVNAAICSQILVDQYQVDGIVNTGIAGSLRDEIDIGDLVLSTVAVQHDMNAVGFGYALGEVPQLGIKEFPADEKLIALAEESCKEANPDIKTYLGRVASGDQFIDNKEKKNWIRENFDAYCAEMEGAAIAQAAYLNKVPYLIIRAISDKADHSAYADDSQFEVKVAARSVNLILTMLKKL